MLAGGLDFAGNLEFLPMMQMQWDLGGLKKNWPLQFGNPSFVAAVVWRLGGS